MKLGSDESNPFTIQYDSTTDVFLATGNLSLSVGDFADVDANFSTDAKTPGLRIANGSVTDVNLNVTGDINVFDIKLAADQSKGGMTFQYQSDDPNNDNVFEMSGFVTLTVGDFADVAATFSDDATMPGLKVVNGTVTDINLNVTGDISVFDIKLAADESKGGMKFQYHKQRSQRRQRV